VEVVPEALLSEISKRTSLLTSSIGGGKGGDIQFLFAEDILGNNPPPYPRHSKQYRKIFELQQALQNERVAGFKDFIKDVQDGTFPAEEHVIKASGTLVSDFLSQIE
jgi:3-methyl-2-oxobutanoate hydroxymethyltransferase